MECQVIKSGLRVQEDREEYKPLTVGFCLDGMQGSMAAHVGHAMENGRHCALVSGTCRDARPGSCRWGTVHYGHHNVGLA